MMQQDGVRSNQVTQIRGYADQLLRVKNDPYDPSNRRISILVKNQEGPLPNLQGASVVNGPAAPAAPSNPAKSPPAKASPQAQSKPAASSPSLLGRIMSKTAAGKK